MSESLLSVRPAFGVWNHGALRIEYGLGVLEEIRRTVQEGFHKIPHGGVETGGLLYGKWDGECLTVSTWRPMQCEHPLGPRFQLSGADELALAAQLATQAPELENYQVVGWFASHSRGALQLRGPDVDLHTKYFPEPWQPILLLCSSRNQPMQAAFYSRMDSTLTVGAEVTPLEVVPNPAAVPRRTRRSAPAAASHTGAETAAIGDSIRILATQVGSEPPQMVAQELAPEPAQPVEPERPAAAAAASTTESVWTAPEAAIPVTITEQASVTEQASIETPVEAPPVSALAREAEAAARQTAQMEGMEEEAAPKFTSAVASERRVPWKRLAWASVWLAIAAGGVYAIPRLSFPVAAPPSLDVQISEVPGAAPGQLSIHWDMKNAPTGALRGGEIQVVDGAADDAGAQGAVQSILLSPAELRTGTVTYRRQSERVDVKVAIQSGNGETVGQASFGQRQPAAKANPGLRALREQLRQDRRRGRVLERELAVKQRK